VHVGGWHTLLVHTSLWQSMPVPHAVPAGHLGHPLPQSVPVSLWFFTPSVQVGTWHVPEQTLLWQSAAAPHVDPAGQSAQVPPQSRSLSSPFLVPSLQLEP
jgi:hypothetical protein